ncbi:MAG: hypothetical protein KDA22_13620, partial [Phycisphaerales bacterium]|nr:hypothetical protein [Phycisphaerales bacterium]
PTPAGRTCDFEINADGDPVYLHVKRLDTDRPAQRQLTVSSHLRYLERIRRPYIVRLRWHDGLDDVTMQRFVTDCARFIQIARVGDEHIVRDDAGREIGGCLIAAPWEGTHVTLAIGLPTGFVDDAPRMHRLLRKAYLQFMPRATNVIMLGTSRDEDVVDFEEALLGTHIERWDRHPPKGRRIAHGRDDDGFWHRRRFAASEAVVWFRSRPQEAVIHPRLWLREDAHLPAPHVALLRRLFGEPETHGAGTL